MTRLWTAGLVFALLLAAASVSPHRSRTFQLVDPDGRPAGAAYVAYSFRGSRPNLVHPVTYEAHPLTLAKGGDDGRVTIPAAVHVHWPFPIETNPSLEIELVYVPRLHNAHGRFGQGSPSFAGIFEIEGDSRARVFDLEPSPEMWEGTLRNLASLISRLIYRPTGQPQLHDTDPAMATLAAELIDHVRAEYDAFLRQYGETARPRPAPPPFTRAGSRELEEWSETVDRDLESRPRWGDLVASELRNELALFERWRAELRGNAQGPSGAGP